MWEKYVSLTPYQYAGNNPVVLFDNNGRDYDLAINNTPNGGTISISATFYNFEGNAESQQAMRNGMSFWNNQNGQWQYITGEGPDRKVYDIKFELRELQLDPSGNIMPGQATRNDVVTLPDEIYQQQGTSIDGSGGYYFSSKITYNGRYVTNDLVDDHEFGHCLGISHNEAFIGVMSKTIGGLTNFVNKYNIADILGHLGIGPMRNKKNVLNNPEKGLGQPTNVAGVNKTPEGFNDGEVVPVH